MYLATLFIWNITVKASIVGRNIVFIYLDDFKSITIILTDNIISFIVTPIDQIYTYRQARGRRNSPNSVKH